MTQEESIFGANLDGLKRLLTVGDDESESTVEDREAATASTDQLTKKAGLRIGRYKLLRVLGEGGMGIVHLAEQSGTIRRKVALKIVKPGMDSKRVIARFEAERQALALLDHLNVANVYDAGTTEAGRPYFVMEYVRGLPITEYCDHHKLSINERLHLFQQVCQAIHHAHQKGIIHRDIKPSNILVSTQDDKAVPKIIDFGVAKAISQPLTERTLLTEENQLLGTPEYMSPEQVDMAGEDIDTRSDIYSLGVLLYVLLTGVLPFDSDTLRTGGIEHIRQIIRETDPKTPSTRLTKLGEEAVEVAKSRQTEVATLAKCLHRELEWIPLKAMRKERVERYRSASELSDDIENYLKGAPLMAGPPTALYRLRKFLRRHKALVGGVAAVLVVSVIGTIVSVTFAIGQARALAESEAVTQFLGNDVLLAVRTIKGKDATAADLLNVASKNLEGKFHRQPVVKARICWHLGRAYRALGDNRAAIPHLTRSYQLRREQFGEHRKSTPYTKNYLALAYCRTGQYNKAERLFDELIEASDPENNRTLPGYKCNLADVYLGQGRYEEAERLLVATLSSEIAWWEWWSEEGKPYLPQLAEIYLYQCRYDEAEQLFNQFFDDRGDAALTDRSTPCLGYLYMAQERYQEAEELFTSGIEYCSRELPGRNNPTTLAHMNGLAVLDTKQKQYEDAERLFHEVLEARKDKLGDNHPSTLQTKNHLGVLFREQGQHDEAEKLLAEARDIRQTTLGHDHPATLESKHELAVLYMAQSKFDKAEPLLLEAFHGRESKLGPEHPRTVDTLKQLIQLYDAMNKPDEVKKWRVKLQQKQEETE
jgi:eukaryotic-like serine/threonine-protein kinase